MLKLRVLTVAVLLPLILAAMFLLPNFWWQIVLMVPLILGASEWAMLARFSPLQKSIFLAVLIAAAGAVALAGLEASVSSDLATLAAKSVYATSIVFWMVIAPCWLWLKIKVRNRFALGAAGLVVLFPMWLALGQLQRHALLLLLLLGVIWIADTAAYFFGKTFGRRKLAPTISPGKTWEGVGGALGTVAVYAVVLCAFPFFRYHIMFAAAAFIAMTAFSVIGDLYESWLKRSIGVKDSGAILPGHGGMLDRIDGVTAALPLAALIFL
jgi:phosphatidate cytidylyltransferase